jgi:cobalt-zinc-cadmium efflux system membrane fusion protein
MTPRPKLLILVSLALAAASLQAAPAGRVTVNEAGLANLGVETAQPRRVSSVAGVAARARVIIPPSREYAVSSMTAGVVDRVHRMAGETVQQGDLLAEVRSNDFVGLQREFVAAAVESDLATSRLDRDRQLVEEGIVSRRRLEESEAAAKAALARRNEYRQLLLQGGMNAAEVRALAASQNFRTTLPLRAPIDGVVTEANAVTGQEVPALAALYRVADLSVLWLEIQVPGESLAAVAEGTPVMLAGRAMPLGRVLSVGRVVDPETQVALARAEVTAPGGLRPGQYVSVVLGSGADASDVVAVPTSAVIRSGDSAYVFVRDAQGFAVRPVRVAGAEGDAIFIAGGPGPDSEVAVAGVAALKALWLSGDGEGG